MVKKIAILMVLAFALGGMFSFGNRIKGAEMAVICDFDGTIADTMTLAFECWNNIADEAGQRKITYEEIQEFKNLGILDFMKRMNVSITQLPFLSKKAMAELHRNIDKMQPVKEMKQALETVKKQGITLGIVTSNSVEVVKAFLERHNMSHLFDFIYSEESILSKFRAFFSKHVVIQKCMKEHNINPDISFYVGDEKRDIEAAKKAGVKAISVTWGFNSRELLQSCNPDYLVETPMDISKIVINEVSNNPQPEAVL